MGDWVCGFGTAWLPGVTHFGVAAVRLLPPSPTLPGASCTPTPCPSVACCPRATAAWTLEQSRRRTHLVARWPFRAARHVSRRRAHSVAKTHAPFWQKIHSGARASATTPDAAATERPSVRATRRGRHPFQYQSPRVYQQKRCVENLPSRPCAHCLTVPDRRVPPAALWTIASAMASSSRTRREPPRPFSRRCHA